MSHKWNPRDPRSYTLLVLTLAVTAFLSGCLETGSLPASSSKVVSQNTPSDLPFNTPAEVPAGRIDNPPAKPSTKVDVAELTSQMSQLIADSALVFSGGIFGAKVFQQLLATLDGRIFSGKQSFSADSISAEDKAEFQKNLNMILNKILAVEQFGGQNSPQVFVAAEEFCTENFQKEVHDACFEIMGHISFHLSLNTKDVTQIQIYFDKLKFIEAESTAGEMQLRILLAEMPEITKFIHSVLDAKFEKNVLPILRAAAGVFQASIKKFQKKTEIVYEIPKDLQLDFSTGEASLHAELGRGSFIEFKYHPGKQKLVVLSKIEKLLLWIDSVDESGSSFRAQAQINDSVSGKFIFDDTKEHFKVADLNFGGQGLRVTRNNEMVLSLVTERPLSSVLKFYDDGFSLSLDKDFRFTISQSDSSSSWSGDSERTRLVQRGEGPALIKAGLLIMENRGGFGQNLKLGPGMCFSGIPWQEVKCHASSEQFLGIDAYGSRVMKATRLHLQDDGTLLSVPVAVQSDISGDARIVPGL